MNALIKRTVLIAIVLSATAVLPGCVAGRWLGYVFAPSSNTKKVPAEYEGLENSKVAVIVDIEQKTLFGHEGLPRELIQIINRDLTRNVKGVTTVEPARVIAYQAAYPEWRGEDRTKIARDLEADNLLYVTIIEFSTLEPGSVNLVRARLVAEATVWKAGLPEREARQYRTETFRVLYPEHAPVGLPTENQYRVRVIAERIFSDRLTKKFYDHKVDLVKEGEEL
ncbi:MAG: hypothetical protein ACLFVU_10510 [Phycisphaerae bacterium]